MKLMIADCKSSSSLGGWNSASISLIVWTQLLEKLRGEDEVFLSHSLLLICSCAVCACVCLREFIIPCAIVKLVFSKLGIVGCVVVCVCACR